MKAFKIFTIILLITFTSSCVVYNDYQQGRAFLSIYSGELIPTYIDTDGALPLGFYYEEFYEVLPGFYSIYYEYRYENGYGTVTESYVADIKISVNEGSHPRDNYFYLDIYPGGQREFYLKSETMNNFQIGDVVKQISKDEDNMNLTATIKKLGHEVVEK